MKIVKWKKIASEKVLTANIFRYHKVKSQSPTTSLVGDFDIIECANWVNVVAITEANEVVMVKQYRHGTEAVTLEIPGGAIDRDEDSHAAAVRELLEETGHESSDWRYLGRVDANPAFMTNYCDTYLALGAKQIRELNLDAFEEIEVTKVPLSEIKRFIKEKKITHSLIIAAFFHLSLDADISF